jgi:hypothetical protein
MVNVESEFELASLLFRGCWVRFGFGVWAVLYSITTGVCLFG